MPPRPFFRRFAWERGRPARSGSGRDGRASRGHSDAPFLSSSVTDLDGCQNENCCHLLFVANYETQDVLSSYAYIVRRDGSALKRVAGGVWSTDGQELWIVRRTELPFGDFVLSRYSLLAQKPTDIDLPFEIPKSIATGRWKPDGTLFAFITNDNEVTFIDLAKQTTFKVADFAEGADLIWLDLE